MVFFSCGSSIDGKYLITIFAQAIPPTTTIKAVKTPGSVAKF
ncbi:hypothetical protein O2U01_09885 (plasmid) [Ligilactobacillus salivarius]|nr:hypothetical protein [Ligilactobacillus salivarius]WHS07019.1 hypothetical protein O2U07_11235 [Ligilactobacillus salivarius]WHS08959.1 hypothetical protein O2U05_10215 [Ligilactobacillus salivarius]WHS21297.1 hypothetical protein O2U01_09885 [Ligilactobacillus salivarius]WNB34931.1 hypothetical protein O2U09_09300 [Ligilactobacillus salivarius]